MDTLRVEIRESLSVLTRIGVETLLQERLEKFLRMGIYAESE